jgi:hypothetical protein
VEGDYEAEVRLLAEAIGGFQEALSARQADQEAGPAQWSLSRLAEWWDDADLSRPTCEKHCRAWRQHLEGILSHERQRALKCIEEIEKRIPLLHSHRLSHLRDQYVTIEKCMVMKVKVDSLR